MNSYYTQYYLNQHGSGLSDIGHLYRSPIVFQRGRGGIGNFFAGLYKYINPFISSGISAIKDQAIKSSTAVLADIGKKPFKTILKEQGKAAISDLTVRGVNKLRKMQQGSGRRRKRNIKRGRVGKRSHSSVKRKRRRTRKPKQIGLGRKRKARQSKKRTSRKKTRFVDIFDNTI